MAVGPAQMLPRSGAAGQFRVRGREGRWYLVPGSMTHLCETVCFPGLALLPGTLGLSPTVPFWFLPFEPVFFSWSQPRPHPHSPVSGHAASCGGSVISSPAESPLLRRCGQVRREEGSTGVYQGLREPHESLAEVHTCLCPRL